MPVPIRIFLLLRERTVASSERSSTLIKAEVNTGLITSATNREEVNTTISVIGKYCIKLPTRPGQKAKGKNAASVVAVDTIMGTATSPAPYLAASTEL